MSMRTDANLKSRHEPFEELHLAYSAKHASAE
jgi:hypothetical protein